MNSNILYIQPSVKISVLYLTGNGASFIEKKKNEKRYTRLYISFSNALINTNDLN